MLIMGPPSESLETVIRLIGSRGSDRFINEMVPALWEEAVLYGVDPVVVIAQSAKETNWGKFTGTVPPEWNNTAGVKIDPAIQKKYPDIAEGNKLWAHTQCANWHHGARVQVLHLRAYCSQPVDDREVVHARYYTVLKLNKGLQHARQLSNNWAGAGYGEEVERIARTLVEIGQ
jgi:hypothetical protein